MAGSGNMSACTSVLWIKNATQSETIADYTSGTAGSGMNKDWTSTVTSDSVPIFGNDSFSQDDDIVLYVRPHNNALWSFAVEMCLWMHKQ